VADALRPRCRTTFDVDFILCGDVMEVIVSPRGIALSEKPEEPINARLRHQEGGGKGVCPLLDEVLRVAVGADNGTRVSVEYGVGILVSIREPLPNSRVLDMNQDDHPRR